jgi:hypothetical protein
LGRRSRGWKAASGLSLADLRRMLEEKEGQLSGLAERRNEFAVELAEVEAELAAAGGGGAMLRGPGQPPGRRGPGRPKGSGRGPGRPRKSGRRLGRPKGSGKRGRKPGPKGQSDLHNAIRAVLKSSAEPMKLVDVVEKVKANGYKTKSKNFGVILGLRLSEVGDVKRVERDVYSPKTRTDAITWWRPSARTSEEPVITWPPLLVSTAQDSLLRNRHSEHDRGTSPQPRKRNCRNHSANDIEVSRLLRGASSRLKRDSIASGRRKVNH